MAVAFSVIFKAHIDEKQLSNASPYKPFDLLMTYSRCGLSRKPKSIIWLTSRTLSTQPLNLHTKCHQNILFSLTLKFLEDSFKEKYPMFKHILSQQKHSNTRISTHMSPSQCKKGFVNLTRLIERSYRRELVETILAEICFSESHKTALQNKPKHQKRFCLSLRLSILLLPFSKRF